MASTAAERAAKEDKAREVAYVRGEKTADERAHERLIAAYGAGTKHHDNTARKKRWTCASCRFYNCDTTSDVCGQCLAPNPAVIAPERTQRNALVPPRQMATLDPAAKVTMIGGRCYREFHFAPQSRVQFKQQQQEGGAAAAAAQQRQFDGNDDEDAADDEPGCCGPSAAGAEEGGMYSGGGVDDDDDDDDGEEGSAVVFNQQRQSWILRMKVPRRFWKFILGKAHKTVLELQRLTGATVKMIEDEPKQSGAAAAAAASSSPPVGVALKDSADDIVEVMGPTKQSVQAARLKIETIMLDNEDRVSYSHFLSIPLAATGPARGAFSSFLQEMMRLCIDNDDGRSNIDPFMFQSPSRVHLTLLMLRLHSEAELQRARELMSPTGVVAAMLKRFFSSESDRLQLARADVMNDDPTEAHVVYLQPMRGHPTTRKLIELVENINRLFIDAGLALPKDVMHNEKLHATVINSKWRAGAVADGSVESVGDGGGARGAVRQAFDATDVLRLFGAEGVNSNVALAFKDGIKLERVDLSILGAGNAADGYFARECSAYF